MFVSDYVLMGYGTGIVMGVPGHDQRDWVDSGDSERPLARRDGQSLTADYLSFTITSLA